LRDPDEKDGGRVRLLYDSEVMMHHGFTILALLLAVSACSPYSANRELNADQQREEKLIQKSKQDFQLDYAAYQIERLPDGVKGPDVKLEKFQRKQVLMAGRGLQLELELGDRWSVATNGVYRTESRYRLRDGKGAVVASAESVYATQDVGSDDVGEWIIAMADHDERAFFIGEKHNWSTERYIVLWEIKDEDGRSGAWSVRYVQVPSRFNGFAAFDVEPELLGVHDRKLVFRMDGRLYAVPLEKLDEVGSLAYSIG